MSNNLRLSVFCVAVLLYVVIFVIFKKGRIPLKYTLVWLMPATIILAIAIMPSILESLTHILGFQTISNMVVGLIIVVLVFITMTLTVIVSGQKTKITLLIQEVSLLKEKMNVDEE